MRRYVKTVIEGLFMLWLGYRLIKYAIKHCEYNHPVVTQKLLSRDDIELELREQINGEMLRAHTFDYQVTMDAVIAPERAKAALRALLEDKGCTENQIEEVIGKVDGVE